MSTSLGSVAGSKKKDVHELIGSRRSLTNIEEDEKEVDDELVRDEVEARKQASHGVLYLVLINGYSSLIVFVVYLISVESLISIGLSVGMTIYAYNRTDASFDGATMNWVLLSFAVITPISSVIGMAFRRREEALQQIATLRSTFTLIFTAHALWDWGDSVTSGRKKSTVDWLEHSDEVLKEIYFICAEFTRYLTLPNSTRARHKITRSGRKEAQNTQAVAARLNESIVLRISRLGSLCEILKREGLPGNEAARIRQWERMVSDCIERLQMVKMYRTPQALRSFSRLFSVFLPPLYAPYYAEMAKDLNSLGMAITFSVITSLALTSLFEAVSQLEDPFVTMSVLDGIQVKTVLIDRFTPKLLALRKRYFPNADKIDQVPDIAVDEMSLPTPEKTIATMRMLAE